MSGIETDMIYANRVSEVSFHTPYLTYNEHKELLFLTNYRSTTRASNRTPNERHARDASQDRQDLHALATILREGKEYP